MIELSDILNDSSTNERKELANIAALLASDNAFAYNSTYITDSADELKRFKDNVNDLKSFLIKNSNYFNKKILSDINSDNYIWAFKLQINNAVEVSSDNISFIIVRHNYENELLKLLTKSNILNFILTLHFKYSLYDYKGKLYDNHFAHHVQHSFEINNIRDIRKSINQFIGIVKLHIDANE